MADVAGDEANHLAGHHQSPLTDQHQARILPPNFHRVLHPVVPGSAAGADIVVCSERSKRLC